MNTMTAPLPAASAPTENSRHALIDVVLRDVENAARDTNVYTFRRPDGGRLPPYKAGAHIDIHLPNGLIRQFSLLNPSADPDSYVVAIKLDAASRGGSRYIFDELKVGDALQIGAPRNNFPLVENAEHVVLFAGGIGITPIWCMAQRLAAQSRSWKLYYSCRSRADMAFLSTIEKFGPDRAHLHFDDEAGGNFSTSPAPSPRRRRTRISIAAGPTRCSRRSRPRREPAARQCARRIFHAQSRGGDAGRLLGRARALGRRILHPARARRFSKCCYEAGIDVDYSCELGICGECVTRVISGIPEHRDSVLSEEEQAANDKVMICCAGCKSERLVLDM